ncbi:MAG TPA: hypothetical protein V6D50_07030 [Chroococcales cyanobacterium]
MHRLAEVQDMTVAADRPMMNDTDFKAKVAGIKENPDLGVSPKPPLGDKRLPLSPPAQGLINA